MNVEAQKFTSFPNDNTKHIDYVITYTCDKNDDGSSKSQDDEEKELMCNLFFDQLKELGFSVYSYEHVHKTDKHVYALLNCPLDVLMDEAERIKLDLVLSNTHMQAEKEPELSCMKKFKDCFKNPDSRKTANTFLTAQFEKSIKFIFEGFDSKSLEKPEIPFSNTLRSLLVDSILNNINLAQKQDLISSAIKSFQKKFQSVTKKINANDNEIESNIAKMEQKLLTDNGLAFMLEKGYFDDAFILHDQTNHKILQQQMHVHIQKKKPDQSEDLSLALSDKIELTKDIRNELHNKWAHPKNLFKYQQINLVRDYFGEQVAFYFAWIGCFIYTLLFPTLIGIIFFIVGVRQSAAKSNYTLIESLNETGKDSLSVYGNFYFNVFVDAFDNDLTPYYALIICLWGAVFSSVWKRDTAVLGFEWDTIKFENDEAYLPEYVRRKKKRDDLLKDKSEFVKYLWSYESYFKKTISFIILILMDCLVAFDIAAIVLLRIFLKIKVFPESSTLQTVIGDVGTSIINILLIMLLQTLYTELASKLTKWENHRTKTEYQDALIYKLFAFSFVNSYSSLIYLAFFRKIDYPNGLFNLGPEYQDKCDNNNCMALLTVQVPIVLFVKPLPSVLKNIVWPYAKHLYKKCQTKSSVEPNTGRSIDNNEDRVKKNNQKIVELYVSMEKFKPESIETIANEYTEKVILYGYIMLFACSFTLGPLFLLIINAIDLKVDGLRLLWLFRRPVGYKAQDIGAWENIMRFLNVAGIVTNAFIIAFTSNWSNSALENKAENRFIFVVAFEHAVFFIWLLLILLFPVMPKVIENKMRIEAKMVKDIILNAKSLKTEIKTSLEGMKVLAHKSTNDSIETEKEIRPKEKPKPSIESDAADSFKINESYNEIQDDYLDMESPDRLPRLKRRKQRLSEYITEHVYTDDLDVAHRPRKNKSEKHRKVAGKILPLKPNLYNN